MNKLVFVKDQSLNAVPFTTDEVIAEYSGINKESVDRAIKRHSDDLKTFGKVGHRVQASNSGQRLKIYQLSEEQATLLVTFLENTKQVIKFKTELVRQFFEMKETLNDRFVKREAGKLATKALNDAIKAREDLDGHAYINFEQLAYKASLGKSATQIKRERLVTPNTPATEYLTTAELDKVNSIKQRIAALIDMGLEYHAIKAISTGQGIKALMINKTEPKAQEGA